MERNGRLPRCATGADHCENADTTENAQYLQFSGRLPRTWRQQKPRPHHLRGRERGGYQAPATTMHHQPHDWKLLGTKFVAIISMNADSPKTSVKGLLRPLWSLRRHEKRKMRLFGGFNPRRDNTSPQHLSSTSYTKYQEHKQRTIREQNGTSKSEKKRGTTV